MTLQLGLIGDNISRSQSPVLHELAGRQSGIDVRYDRLIPADLGRDFDEVFAECASGTFRGINVTYPYKERAARKVTVEDPLVHSIGAINTVIFEEDGPKGANTDYSGFMAAYRRVAGMAAPGPTLLVGTGGVGRAIAFALLALGATEIRLVDRDLAKADRLAAELRPIAPGITLSTGTDAAEMAGGADGLVNCTPVGMHGYEGTPVPGDAMHGDGWVFDAVYTPKDTEFLADAARMGRLVISGWELFFYQGVHAWKLFTGQAVDEDRLRLDLMAGTEI